MCGELASKISRARINLSVEVKRYALHYGSMHEKNYLAPDMCRCVGAGASHAGLGKRTGQQNRRAEPGGPERTASCPARRRGRSAVRGRDRKALVGGRKGEGKPGYRAKPCARC